LLRYVIDLDTALVTLLQFVNILPVNVTMSCT
jgi:hypothetical protein